MVKIIPSNPSTIKATNIKTGEVITFKDVGSNLHLFKLRFSSLEWKIEYEYEQQTPVVKP